ncbi:MAG: 30S ribosomal protein S17 [Dehalococcoidia bacterium]|nr:30S ribosomal protein S17 [Dehalococcoidia bacterium]
MGNKVIISGRVVGDSMDKTVVVAVESVRRHPLYKKPMRRVTKYLAHDEGNVYHVGDTVEIVQARPLSRRKRWRVVGGVVAGGADVVDAAVAAEEPGEGGEE